MIRITFDKSTETLEKVKTAISLNIYLGLYISVDGEAFFQGIEDGDCFSEFIFTFFSDSLISLPKLYEQKPMKYSASDVPDTYLILEPRGQDLALIFDSRAYHTRRDVTVSLKDFAKELIRASTDFLNYVLDTNPSLKTERTVSYFTEWINAAEDWYKNTYGEIA